jgi:hypothetical protein
MVGTICGGGTTDSSAWASTLPLLSPLAGA